MEQSTSESKDVPSISIIDITESPNGEANISFEVSDDFIEMVRKEKNIEDVTQEILSEYVNDLLSKCANKTDGYDYTKLPQN
tara:strand:+ start:12476 stop:12721 length:246 start_codon:yes stop_codon:yes gene_type:complete